MGVVVCGGGCLWGWLFVVVVVRVKVRAKVMV